MIDPKLLRASTAEVAANLARRGFDFDADAYLALEEKRKTLQVETESLKSEKNASAKQIGQAKARGEDIEPLLAAVKSFGDRLDEAEAGLEAVLEALRNIELGLPNLLADDVPEGSSEHDNVEVRRWSEPAAFPFDPRDHVSLGADLGLLDFDAAARISGSRFAVMRGNLSDLRSGLPAQTVLKVGQPVHRLDRVALGVGDLAASLMEQPSAIEQHGSDIAGFLVEFAETLFPRVGQRVGNIPSGLRREMFQYLAQLLGAPVMRQQSVSPGRHRLGQRQQPQRMSGRSGIENDQLIGIALVGNQPGYPLQQRCFLSARRVLG